jgi:Flp pilus assembly protein TadB
MRACAVLACAGVLLGLAVGPATEASARARISHPTLMILLDNNSDNTSGTDWLAIARQAALAYAGALPSDVRAGLITFGGQWQLVLRPTTDRRQLEAAVQAMTGAGGSFYSSAGIYGALAGVWSAVPGLRSPGSRLVVISDAENLTGPVPTSVIRTDVITQFLDDDDYIAKLNRLAASSGGRAGGPGRAAALARAAFGVPTARTPAPKPHQPPAKPHGAQPSWPWSLIAGLAALFAALFILVLVALGSIARAGRERDLAGRIGHYGPKHATPVVQDEAADSRSVSRVAQGVAGRLMSSAAHDRLAERLDIAGIARKPAEWALLGGCLGIAIAAALSLVTSYVLLGVLAGALIGWLAMRLSLSLRIVRRRAAFADQLPDVLQLIASALRSGFSLPQALDAVVREDHQPIAGEFSRALGEARLGGDFEDGLEAVASRMESDDLHWTVLAIRIQQGVGGNLAEVLLTIAGTIRERAFLRRHIRALSAEGRLSAYILIALPLLVGTWLFVTDPHYMRPLYTTRIGDIVLVVGSLMLVLGIFWMRKTIKIEV